MAHPKLKPFSFPDLSAAPDIAASPVAAVAGAAIADIEAARAEGVNEGRRLAMETIAAEEAAALARIADACALLVEQSRSVDLVREELRAQCAAFLEAFATQLTAAREADLAMSLINRLALSPENRKPATLHLGARNFARLSESLAPRLEAVGLTDVVKLAPDKSLRAGECRMTWHDGQARCTSAEIRTEIAKLFPATPNATEARK